MSNLEYVSPETRNNLEYVSHETREHIAAVIESPTVSDCTKQLIKAGLKQDCVDAVIYIQIALDALTRVREDILNS